MGRRGGVPEPPRGALPGRSRANPRAYLLVLLHAPRDRRLLARPCQRWRRDLPRHVPARPAHGQAAARAAPESRCIDDRLRRSRAGPARAGPQPRRGRLRALPGRRAVRLPARGRGRRRGAGRHRRGARRRPDRLHCAADLPATPARAAHAALPARARGRQHGRGKALEADRRRAARPVASRAGAAQGTGVSRPARRPRTGAPDLDAGPYPRAARRGTATLRSEPSTSARAAYSAQLGRSPRNSMPLMTPTTGMTSMLSEKTVTDTEVASLIHAQCAHANATSTL